jgi:hypothetical protein
MVPGMSTKLRLEFDGLRAIPMTGGTIEHATDLTAQAAAQAE